jgi:hypothetical protein
MGLKKAAVAGKGLRCDRAVIPTDTNATIALKQRNGVFYAVRAEM